MPRRAAWKLLVLGLLLAAGLAALAGLPVRESLLGLLARIEALGPWGPVALAAAYVPACVLMLPGSLLSLGAGYLFGVGWGTLTVSVGSVAGATAAFVTGRTLARPWVESRLAGEPRFRALDAAVAREGFKIVLLARLSPVLPFNVLNYALGLTRVRLRDYVLASWIGMLPGTVLYVYLGSAAGSLAELAGGRGTAGPAERALFFVGLAATVAVTVVLARVARRALSEALAATGPTITATATTPGEVAAQSPVSSSASSCVRSSSPAAGIGSSPAAQQSPAAGEQSSAAQQSPAAPQPPPP